MLNYHSIFTLGLILILKVISMHKKPFSRSILKETIYIKLDQSLIQTYKVNIDFIKTM